MIKKYPVIKFTILLALGIVFERLWPFPVLNYVVFLIICILASSLLINKGNISFYLWQISLSLAIIAAGGLLYSLNNPAITQIPFDGKYQKELTVTGKITDINLKQPGKIVFYIETGVFEKEKPDTVFMHPYSFLCSLKDTLASEIDSAYNLLVPGMTMQFKCSYYDGGSLRNPGAFDYGTYLRAKGIAGILKIKNKSDISILRYNVHSVANWLFRLRSGIADRIDSTFDPASAGLAKGLLLGDKNEIPDDIQTAFVNAGVAHVLTVSGLNVAYISLMVFFLLGRLQLKTRYICSAIVITIFWMIAGNSPPVLRAVLMGYIVCANFFLGRNTHSLNTLFLTAAIVLFIAPSELFTASFQLSFGGVFSILIIYPPLKRYVAAFPIKTKWVKKLLLFSAVTVAAQIGLLPITNFYFGKLSYTSILANVLVVPLTSMLMGTQILALLISLLWSPLAAILSAGCSGITYITYWVVILTGSSSFSYFSIGGFSYLAVVTYYAVLSMLIYFLPQFTSLRSKTFLLTSATLCLIMVHIVMIHPLFEKGKLNILTIDVGQGDATLIQTPEGETILVDAGNGNIDFDNGKRVILPLLDYLHIDKIDYAIISHLDADHYKGIFALLSAGKIKTLLKPPSYRHIEDSVLVYYANRHDVKSFVPNDSVWQIGGCRIYFMDNQSAWQVPSFSPNDMSLCFRLQYGNTSALFTGDAQGGRETLWTEGLGSLIDVDYLKVAHHGSKHGTTKQFLELATPSIAVISVGERNIYQHPNKEVLERLQTAGTRIYRTDKQGAIFFQSNGVKFEEVGWR